MARGEVTGRKPMVTADPTKRKPGPPSADPGAVEPMAHSEPQWSASHEAAYSRTAARNVYPRVLHGASHLGRHVLQDEATGVGPAVMRVGTRTLISIEAAAEWRKAREQAATEAA